MPESEKASDATPFDFGDDFDARNAARRLETARENLATASERAAKIANSLSDHGRSEAEIAARLGVTRRTVRRWIGRAAP